MHGSRGCRSCGSQTQAANAGSAIQCQICHANILSWKEKISKASQASSSQPLEAARGWQWVPPGLCWGCCASLPCSGISPSLPPAVLPTKGQKIAGAEAAGMEHPSPPTQVTAASASRCQFVASTCSLFPFLRQTLRFLAGADSPFLCPKHLLQPDTQFKLVDSCCPMLDQSQAWAQGAAAHGVARPSLFAGQICCLNNSAQSKLEGAGGEANLRLSVRGPG